jgi:FHA domain-containing protein
MMYDERDNDMATPEQDDEKTRLIRRPPKARPPESSPSEKIPVPSPEDSEMTRLIGPPRRVASTSAPVAAGKTSGDLEDPVVGWLVIVNGPGRGSAHRLGYGQNSVGRDRGERVCLDFGDESVSRTKHCFVIYEPRKREYILRPGDGANLTYLNGKLLSEPRPLKAADLIELGGTTLRFVPLCGPDFEWQDQPPSPRRQK